MHPSKTVTIPCTFRNNLFARAPGPAKIKRLGTRPRAQAIALGRVFKLRERYVGMKFVVRKAGREEVGQRPMHINLRNLSVEGPSDRITLFEPFDTLGYGPNGPSFLSPAQRAGLLLPDPAPQRGAIVPSRPFRPPVNSYTSSPRPLAWAKESRPVGPHDRSPNQKTSAKLALMGQRPCLLAQRRAR